MRQNCFSLNLEDYFTPFRNNISGTNATIKTPYGTKKLIDADWTASGCACAGTNGHILLHVNQDESMKIYNQIIGNDNSQKPGWVRMSFHPTVSNQEVDFILNALKEVAKNIEEWQKEYVYDKQNNNLVHVTHQCQIIENAHVEDWYTQKLV